MDLSVWTWQPEARPGSPVRLSDLLTAFARALVTVRPVPLPAY